MAQVMAGLITMMMCECGDLPPTPPSTTQNVGRLGKWGAENILFYLTNHAGLGQTKYKATLRECSKYKKIKSRSKKNFNRQNFPRRLKVLHL